METLKMTSTVNIYVYIHIRYKKKKKIFWNREMGSKKTVLWMVKLFMISTVPASRSKTNKMKMKSKHKRFSTAAESYLDRYR